MATLRINARFVKEMMFRREIDQLALSKKAGISEPTMIRLMRGEAFKSDTLGRLAEALDCSPVDLLDVSEYPDPHMAAPAPVI